MDTALIENNVVTQVWRGQFLQGVNLFHFANGVPVAGMLWDGTALANPPVAAPVVPHSVSMRQARIALRRAGLLPTVQAAINAADEDTQLEWEYAVDVWRDRDLVVNLGATLGLSDGQIDALFIAAAAIP